jgi:hypothetical protein
MAAIKTMPCFHIRFCFGCNRFLQKPATPLFLQAIAVAADGDDVAVVDEAIEDLPRAFHGTSNYKLVMPRLGARLERVSGVRATARLGRLTAALRSRWRSRRWWSQAFLPVSRRARWMLQRKAPPIDQG